MKQPNQAMLILLAVTSASVGVHGFDFHEPVQPPRSFQVMVHRGMMHQAPENTLPALERVIEDGLEWAEVDVRLTKDHRHVIFHDSSVDAKTDGSGKVRDLTLEEIKRLDAGGWFAPRYAGQRVLTLAQCLALAKGRLNLYLDCKDIDPELLAHEILEADMARQVAVFDDLEVLAAIRKFSEGRIPLMPKWRGSFGLEAWAEKWRPDAVEINAEEVTPEVCRFFHQRHIKVQAKVLGDDDRPEVWDRMLAAGVDWLQTDRPEDILAHRMWKSLDRRPVEMAIHRGASRYAPENTLAAFKKAVALGADYVEIDIRTAQDGQQFILHDRDLDRTTNGRGPVAGIDAAAIADLDAGAWFGRNYQKTPVPRLDDTLDYLNGKAQLYVDAKDISVETLVKKLRAKGMADKAVVYQSPAYLEKLKDLWPEARGLCPLGDPKQVERLAQRLQPYAFDASWAILSRELIDRCHALGIKVFSDGIGDHESVEDYLQAIEWGIDLIQTDHPLRVIRAVEMANLQEHNQSLPNRLINETRLEEEANAISARAKQKGSEEAIQEAMTVLNQCITRPVSPDLRTRIEQPCEALFHSCGLQTSVPEYYASGAERGAFLDFVDYPLNNRWWLEDEFQKVRAMASEAEKVECLNVLARWENPGPGSYYDDVGNPAKSPHVKRSPFPFTEPGEEARPEPTLWWWDDGKSRARLSWQVSMNYPEAVVYEGLDPDATYTVRCGGYGQFLLVIDGEDAAAPARRAEMGANQDFHVPSRHLQDRKLIWTWKQPTDESHLNWRQHSRLAEIWLLKDWGGH
jgi:glycerophosphoryl diester phosphodiesterase